MIRIKSIASILILAASLWSGCDTSENNTGKAAEDNTIVLLRFKAQPEKGGLAVAEWTGLIEQVREEPHFVSITLHVDPADSVNILLYEKWEDASYYNNEHMNTAHMKAFITNSRNFLEGPPDISFWKVGKEFK